MTSPREAWIEARLCTRSARRLVTCKMWIVVLPRVPPQTALRLPGGQDARTLSRAKYPLWEGS